MALKLTGVGRGGIPKGAFQLRIEKALLRRIRFKHYKTPQDFAATDTTYPDWGDLSCQSLDVQVDRPSYVHGAVANINGSFREVGKLRQEFAAHENRVVRLLAKFRGPPRNLDVRAITIFTAPRIAWKCAGGRGAQARIIRLSTPPVKDNPMDCFPRKYLGRTRVQVSFNFS